jgi:hypothetical protein
MKRWFRGNALLALLALLPVACGRAQGEQDAEAEAVPAYELTAEEARAARELAERGLVRPEDRDSPGGKVVFTKVELLPDSRAQTAQRLVTVTHYRYRGGEAVLTTVDLNTRQVVDVAVDPNMPTGLAQEEYARALELAKADARLAAFWANRTEDTVVEAKVSHHPAGDPLHGRRTVVLLFREGRNYLTSPQVTVDLTSETVGVQTAAARPE